MDQWKDHIWKSQLSTWDVTFSCCNFNALSYLSVIVLLDVSLTISLINTVGKTMVTVVTNIIQYCLHRKDTLVAIFVLPIVGIYKYQIFAHSDSIMFTPSFMKRGSLVPKLVPEDDCWQRGSWIFDPSVEGPLFRPEWHDTVTGCVQYECGVVLSVVFRS